MKKLYFLSGIFMIAALFMACSKPYSVIEPPAHNPWLNQERGDVVFSDPYCNYYVVETDYGYTILRAFGGAMPYTGDIMFGDFGRYGTRQFYNYSANYVVNAQVVEADLGYIQAQNALDYYCPEFWRSEADKVDRILKSGKEKIQRPS